MQVGDVLPFTDKTAWGTTAILEYKRAQEYTRKTGRLFEVVTLHPPAPNENAISGFVIKRTR